MPRCQKCSSTFPNHIRVGEKVRNLQRRKFCLDCSPFGKHNTRDLNEDPDRIVGALPDSARCSRCDQTLPAEAFYRRRNERALLAYCKDCTNRQAVERQQRQKRLAVDYKGGRCQHCGYDRYVGALDFHHTDGSRKDFDVSHGKCTSFDKIKPELDKCILLCANCHREEHARLKGIFERPPLSLSPEGAEVLN